MECLSEASIAYQCPPVSKLSFFSKSLELLVSLQLRVFLKVNSILDWHSSQAVAAVVNDIVNSLDKKLHCAAIFVDLLIILVC